MENHPPAEQTMPDTATGTRTWSNHLVRALSQLQRTGPLEEIAAGFVQQVCELFQARAVCWWTYDLREQTLALDAVGCPIGEDLPRTVLPRSEGFLSSVLDHDQPQLFEGIPLPASFERLIPSRGSMTTLGIRVGSASRPHGVLMVIVAGRSSLALHELETLRLLASAWARSLDGTLLKQELQAQVHRLLLLHDLSRILQGSEALDVRLQKLADALTHSFDARFGHILIFNPREQRLEFRAVSQVSTEQMEALDNIELRPGRGIVGQVFESGLPRLAQDTRRDPDYIEGQPGVRCELAVPIRASGKVIGVLNLESDQVEAFDHEDQRLAGILALQIGTTLQHALAYEEALARLNELELLNRITRAIATIEEVGVLLQQVVQEIQYFFTNTLVGVLLVDPDSCALRAQATSGEWHEAVNRLDLSKGRGITGVAAQTGQTVYVPDVTLDPRYLAVDPTIRSELAVPLSGDQGVIGVLNLESRSIDAFSPGDRRIVEIVGAQISQILVKALLYQKMQTMAITDGLTGLFNHRTFFERLETEFKRSARYAYPLSIIMIDLDLFKEFNDTYGHLQGDQVLREVATLLTHSVRETDLVARYGGEEFAVILPLCHESTAVEVAERIRQTVADTRWKQTSEGTRLTVSIGICTAPHHAATHEELVRRADDAMYASKRDGRNRCTVWKPAE